MCVTEIAISKENKEIIDELCTKCLLDSERGISYLMNTKPMTITIIEKLIYRVKPFIEMQCLKNSSRNAQDSKTCKKNTSFCNISIFSLVEKYIFI